MFRNLIRSVPNLFSATLALYELLKGNAKATCILSEAGSEILLIGKFEYKHEI